ncbi:SWI/SNF and RSC complex subunit Ssr3 [Conoideocrella luteorostrata]|uniref:SWI/SNF and RSC complex subunit Ssr3 n=1 Tax=Conoideocrella luteorostrata TaxID=1105319 RepID=A0AAJ0CVG8_9HYPO|nr:SWI/SNF and RSC complex subunit Ssr3 [Conoideocrella luteorostrata]
MQPQYRNYAQQVPQRSPHGANQRRGGIGPMMSSGPHPSVPLTQAQIAQQQQAQAHANELARRRSRKPTDKNIPEGVKDSIIDPEAVQRYTTLRDVERMLDATTTRKRLDVSETSSRTASKLCRTLRIWVSNTVEDQAWQGNGLSVDAFDFTPNMEASYRVKIEGRLVDVDQIITGRPTTHSSETAFIPSPGNTGVSEDSRRYHGNPLDTTASSADNSRFSHFFKAMSVSFDGSKPTKNSEQTIEWKKPEASSKSSSATTSSSGDFDELTFKRNGDENINITINLHRHEFPERYQLSTELAEIVDMTEATQQDAVTALWEYIRLWNLQEDEEKRNFRCDELLKRVVGRGDIGYIPMLNEYVAQHLRPLPPISLPYTIRVDEEFHKDPQATVYDVQVLLDDPLRSTLQPLVNKGDYAAMLKDVTLLDEQLARLIQAMAVSKAKHSFFTSLSQDPADFVKSWLSSQKRDLEVILGDTARGGEDALTADEWRQGGAHSVWATQNARESVNVLLSRHR